MNKPSRQTAEELVACLTQQAEQFQSFLELLTKQRDALVRRDADELDRIATAQEQAAFESRRLEQKRRALTAKLAADLGEGVDGQTVSGIAQLVAASDASRLSEMREMLQGLQQEIERRKRSNQRLIEQSMRCTGEALKWMAQRMRPQPVYGPRGARPAPGSGPIAINRNC